MKKVWRWFITLFLLLSVVSCSCVTTTQSPYQELSYQVNSDSSIFTLPRINHLEKSTVILLAKDYDADEFALACAGVVLSDDTILTARHCLKAAIPEFEIYSQLFNEDPPYQKGIGRIFYFTTAENSKKIYKLSQGEQPFAALIVNVDPENDLALLQPLSDFPHERVIIDPLVRFWVGEQIDIMGHGGSMSYSYIPGTISNMHDMESDSEKGLTIQVSAPIYMGNSGGGMFDVNGNLLGICSKFSIHTPNVGFFVSSTSIWNFVSQYRSTEHESKEISE